MGVGYGPQGLRFCTSMVKFRTSHQRGNSQKSRQAGEDARLQLKIMFNCKTASNPSCALALIFSITRLGFRSMSWKNIIPRTIVTRVRSNREPINFLHLDIGVHYFGELTTYVFANSTMQDHAYYINPNYSYVVTFLHTSTMYIYF